MRYILDGNSSEIEKVIRENRIRISRGLISLTPYPETESLTDTKDVDVKDTKDVKITDTK